MDSENTMIARHGLSELPLEVLQHVYACLSTLNDRIQLSRTCVVLHQLFKESPALQYDMQLTVADQLDVPNGTRPGAAGDSTAYSSLNAKAKLELLRAREDAWRNLSYRDKQELVVDGAAGVYELQDGIFLMCDGYEPPMHHNGRPTVIRLLPLPGVDDERLGRQRPPIEKKKLDFQIADLTMDPTQDLIVVSEHNPPQPNTNAQIVSNRYHLLSLSTFEPHPLASMPVLDFPPSGRRPLQTRQLLQVLGDTLVILVSRFTANWMMAMAGELQIGNMMLGPEIQEELVCWNWKTGKVLARKALLSTNFFTSLAVLSPSSFLITCTETQPSALDQEVDARDYPPVIELYHIPPANDDQAVEQLIHVESEDTWTPRPRLLKRLGLPRFAPGVTLNAFEVRPDPAFAPLRADQPAKFGTRKPFTQDPAKGVLVFDISAQEPEMTFPFGNFGIPLPLHHGGQMRLYELFVLREYMNDVVESALQSESTEDSVPTTIWEDWGEEHSRMNPTTMSRRTWVCSCSGYRFVSLYPDSTRPLHANPDADSDSDSAPQAMAPLRRVRIHDFSPYNLRRQLAENDGKEPDAVPQSNPPTLPPVDPSVTHDMIMDEFLAIVQGAGSQDPDLETDDDDQSEGWITAASEVGSNESMSDDGQDSEPEPEPEIANVPTGPRYGRVRTITERTVLRRLKIWERPVRSRLPYRVVELEDEFRANGVMIDEERVMVVHTKKRLTPDGELKTTQTMTVLMM